MRTITMFIFFVLLASTAKAQTVEFNFDCYAAAIAAIPDAMPDDPDDLYDRIAYINNIVTPDGFGIDANDETITVYEGDDSDSGTQRWYYQGDYNYISYLEFNVVYRIIRRVLINLEYGYEPLYGIL